MRLPSVLDGVEALVPVTACNALSTADCTAPLPAVLVPVLLPVPLVAVLLPAVDAFALSDATSCWYAALKVENRLDDAEEAVLELPSCNVDKTSLSVACARSVASAAMEAAVPLFVLDAALVADGALAAGEAAGVMPDTAGLEMPDTALMDIIWPLGLLTVPSCRPPPVKLECSTPRSATGTGKRQRRDAATRDRRAIMLSPLTT